MREFILSALSVGLLSFMAVGELANTPVSYSNTQQLQRD